MLAAAPWPRIAFTPVANGFSSPTQVTSARDRSGRLFVVEQRGRVRIVKGGVVLPAPFLDITNRVSCCSERGLLSIAFEPGNGPKGYFWADYTDVNGDTAISRFSFSGDAASAASETVVLRVPQPFANHNGGWLGLGPDGYLYVAMGDGGGGNDPYNNGQTLVNSLLGKLLRLDVAATITPPTRCATTGFPASNPFVGASSATIGIWAYGLQEPVAQLVQSRKTGDLSISNVGQGTWEEIDYQSAGAPQAGPTTAGASRRALTATTRRPAAASPGSRCPLPSTDT